MKYRIIVDTTVDFDSGTTSFELLQPNEQKMLTTEQMAAFLSGALALCIRSSENDAEIMRTVMSYLENEFINPDAFDDRVITPKS